MIEGEGDQIIVPRALVRGRIFWKTKSAIYDPVRGERGEGEEGSRPESWSHRILYFLLLV
jgi:hypothetical protein